MFCHENSTTVFEWLNGCFIGSDFPGSFYDFLFVESDNRTVYRECADFVCCCKALQGLAGNLTDAFSSDQTETSAFFCEMLCNRNDAMETDRTSKGENISEEGTEDTGKIKEGTGEEIRGVEYTKEQINEALAAGSREAAAA